VRWDLYALGVLVYEALTGRNPFSAQSLAVLIQEKLDGVDHSISLTREGLSPEFSALVDSLVSKDPARRPQSAAEALERLRSVPELGRDALTTMPFRHSERIEYSAESSRLDFLTPSSAVPSQTGSYLRPGSLVAILIVLGLISAGAYYVGISRANNVEPVVPPTVAAIGTPGEIRDLVTTKLHTVFSYDDGKSGRELWVASPAGAVSLVADINPGPGSSNPNQFIADGSGRLIFVATTKLQGEEPWVFDVPNHTRIVMDIVAGPMHSEPRLVAARGKEFYFYASTTSTDEELWVSDSSQKRTGPLVDLSPAFALLPGREKQLHVDESGIVYHYKLNEVHHLIKYRFSDKSVQDLGTIDGDRSFVRPHFGDLEFLGDKCIFTCYRPETGRELWSVDPGGGKAMLLKDTWPGTESGDPTEFYLWNGALYFRATTLEHGSELWKSDGSPGGTVEIADLRAGAENGDPSNLTGSTDRLFFRASHLNLGIELWSIDGVPGHPPVLYDINPGRESSHPYSLKVFGGYLFFSANDGANGEEFWAIDLLVPNGEPFLVKDIKDGPESSEPHKLTVLDETTGVFVYKTDRGEGLMKVEVIDRDIELTPYNPLPLK